MYCKTNARGSCGLRLGALAFAVVAVRCLGRLVVLEYTTPALAQIARVFWRAIAPQAALSAALQPGRALAIAAGTARAVVRVAAPPCARPTPAL